MSLLTSAKNLSNLDNWTAYAQNKRFKSLLHKNLSSKASIHPLYKVIKCIVAITLQFQQLNKTSTKSEWLTKAMSDLIKSFILGRRGRAETKGPRIIYSQIYSDPFTEIATLFICKDCYLW